eukprot:scaffold103_cov193-Alexandrium_tamarense.AAC.19
MFRAAVVARVAEEYENETEAIVSGMGGRWQLAVCAFELCGGFSGLTLKCPHPVRRRNNKWQSEARH